ncbi:MAG: flagellar biosynthesis protein FlhF [Zoogloeaceae bacterium]|jgi:flagellar biosynthesis protein FlhF|nr:flagellar biosynthesis protein FlhF [Zoogloeaceae bacterium]
MNVRKFIAANAREALRKVKETLGPDAIILSNRTISGNVEIMAVAARDMAMMASPEERPAPRPSAAFADDSADYRVSLSDARRAANAPATFTAPAAPATMPPRQATTQTATQAIAQSVPQAVPQAEARAAQPRQPAPPRQSPPAAPRRLVNASILMPESLRGANDALRPPAAPRAPAVEARTAEVVPAEMVEEIRSLKKMVEQHLAGIAWGETARAEPVKTEVLRRMLEAGFSPLFSRELIADLPSGMAINEALAWSRGVADRSLATARQDIVDKGGVYALMGPTGVGKTTTTAKLAARCVLRHGANKVALVTTDSYRIGAYEQLRSYGRILGVPVYLAQNAAELRQTLNELAHKHMVLIDTMGMSQKDKLVAELNAMLANSAVRRLLLLSATTRGDTLDDVVHAYRGQDLSGCILTKIDETSGLAPALDAILRHGLTLHYVSNGQRVPEDLHLPNRAYLLHRAFKDTAESAHRYSGLEPGLMMGNAGLSAATGG